MKNITSFNYIYYLLKLAARDIPDFYPDWVKEHPLLKKYDLLSEITKSIPIEDYRESVEFSTMLSDDGLEDKIVILLEEVADLLIRMKRYLAGVSNRFKSISSGVDPDIQIKIKKIDNFISACNGIRSGLSIDKCVEILNKSDKLSEGIILNRDVVTSGFDKVTPKGVFKTQLKYNAGINLNSVCRMLIADLKKHLDIEPNSSFEALKDITNLDSYKELSYYVSKFRNDQKEKAKQDFEIVFSKQPSDLLRMSVSSDWTSCQNLCKDKTRQNVKAIYSSVSPNVGIIYLTNKNPYKERGEEMIARSLVFYLESSDDSPPILYVGKVYSNYEKSKIKDLFVESLKKHTSLRVEGNDAVQYSEYHFPFDKEAEDSFLEEIFRYKRPDEEDKEIRERMPILPYFDTQEEDRSKYIFPIGTKGKTYYPGD